MALPLSKLRHRLRVASRPRRCGTRDERGFTFVEALVATTILAGGMVAVAQLLAISLQMHHHGRSTSEASTLATRKVEELVKLNFDTAPAVAVSPVSPDPLGQDVTGYFDTSGLYTRRWRVVAGPATDTRTVTVRIIPPNVDLNRFRTVEVTTILRRW